MTEKLAILIAIGLGVYFVAALIAFGKKSNKKGYTKSKRKTKSGFSEEYKDYVNRYKGEQGEAWVQSELGQNEAGKKYVLNDVMICNQTKEGVASTQIDHIVLTRYGVFVIETKMYSGRIYGKEGDKHWTQVLKFGEVKNQLYNPILQNDTHLYALKKYAGSMLSEAQKDSFYSLVVFPVAELSVEWEHTPVCDIEGAKDFIHRAGKNAEQTGYSVFSEQELVALYQCLLQAKNDTPIGMEEHIARIKQKHG
ncbi:MAG: NERD domain-containing protein [Firmicutes bacterium]|nr:NERD domain-containing protein [Bacillota bacterium]